LDLDPILDFEDAASLAALIQDVLEAAFLGSLNLAERAHVLMLFHYHQVLIRQLHILVILLLRWKQKEVICEFPNQVWVVKKGVLALEI
jgi:hypothetical protein